MEKMLDIRLLGSPLVTVEGRVVEVDTRKAIALLAYLAVERAADRGVLATLFWAESPPDRARATLRRTLSSLRSGIGAQAIEADRNRVELLPRFRSDIDDFNAAAEESTTHGHGMHDVCERCIQPLTIASDLYRGDFLGSFAVRDAPDFEDWARVVTESFRLKAGEVFSRLAMALASVGDYTRAIDVAARWISLNDIHEPAHRLTMLLHTWSGDRAGAIQAYRSCVATLDRELGVSPLEETTELYEAILDEDLPPAPGVRREPKAVQTTAPAVSGAMLNRGTQRAALGRALEDAVEGGRLGLVTGDSWMGKTRLIEELIGRARGMAWTIVDAKAFRAEGGVPYGVATQLLHKTIASIDSDADLPTWAVEELSRLDPKLAPGPTPPSSKRTGQIRLREAFLTLLETAASANPLLVTVDDAQWIDPASAELVGYLFRRLDSNPVLAVLATREEASLHPALREIIADQGEIIQLTPLEAADIRDDHPDADVDRVLAETGGIPLLVQESLESQSATPDSGSVIRYMDSRRERLTSLGRQVAAAAAVLDGMCDAQLLRDTSGRTDDEIVDAVEELVSAGLLREEPDGRLGFTLDALESVTYESTSLIRRRLLHRRAAEALAARPRSRTDPRLATATAGHMRTAGNDEAAEWYRLAGDLARAVFANDEAADSYEMSIALGHPDVGELRLALGELAMARGDYQLATTELRAAASHCEGPNLALVEHRIGDLHRILGKFELAEESFGRASTVHPYPADLKADWALLKHRLGDEAKAMSLARAAFEEAGNDDHLARALNIMALVTPDPTRAMEHVDEALRVAGSAVPPRMAALNNKAALLSGSGDVEGAMTLISEAIDLAARTGYRHQQAALLNHLADLNHQTGRREEAEELLTQAVRLFANVAVGDWEPEVWLLRSW